MKTKFGHSVAMLLSVACVGLAHAQVDTTVMLATKRITPQGHIVPYCIIQDANSTIGREVEVACPSDPDIVSITDMKLDPSTCRSLQHTIQSLSNLHQVLCIENDTVLRSIVRQSQIESPEMSAQMEELRKKLRNGRQ